MSEIAWSFSGHRVVGAGPSHGIGLATANLFATAGAEVFALSRSKPAEDLHGDVHVFSCDVSSEDELSDTVEQEAAGRAGSTSASPTWASRWWKNTSRSTMR